MKLIFEWDDQKAKSNLKKHRVSFDEAVTVFTDPFSLTIPDHEQSSGEQRYIDIGSSEKSRILVVVYTERGSKVRIVSGRKATKSERKIYEENNG